MPIMFHFLLLSKKNERLHGAMICASDEKLPIVPALPPEAHTCTIAQIIPKAGIIMDEKKLRRNEPALVLGAVLRPCPAACE